MHIFNICKRQVAYFGCNKYIITFASYGEAGTDSGPP